MTPASPGTLLVVDDNPATLYSTSRVLRSAGYTVLEAATGASALSVATHGLDLVVLDINLPDIDGFEVCRRLRTIPETSAIPVVHLSASFVNDIDKVHGLEQGADGYLTHPVEPPVLIATVKAFLRARTAENQRRTSEAKFKAVFDHAQHGIALLSEAMTFLEINPAMSSLLGADSAAVIGRHLSTFVPPGLDARITDIDQALARGEARRVTFPVVRPDGNAVELEWTISPHPVAHMRLAIVADVTERERLLTSERAARAEAERANTSKDEFLAAVSHELRTPLNAIVGWSQLLKRKASSDAEVVRGMTSIERNAQVQAQLIADLLDVSRITSGKLTLELQPFDAAEAVDIAADAIRSAADARGVRIVSDLAGGGRMLVWDQVRFQQVVWNLLDNAVKFSPEGGVVHLRLTADEHEMQLTVQDGGRGISPEFLPHVFDRFRQEDATTRRQHGGLGLGLAIVRSLVEAHGGSIHALSPGEGQGATFVVRMPRTRDPRRYTRHDIHGSVNLSGLRVLVVDDDEDARAHVERVLRDAGATVAQAADVADAMVQLERGDPHVLISDIGMPGEDGYDLIRRVRERYLATKLPSIALTAFARPDDQERALAMGYQGHLPKPLNVARLLEMVAALVPQAGNKA